LASVTRFSTSAAASGTIESPMTPSAISAPYQPSVDSRSCVTGSMANWPNDPAAAEMPSTMLRFSGG
jgi:hypothetical protein